MLPKREKEAHIQFWTTQELKTVLKRVCVDHNMTITEVMSQYLEYLRDQYLSKERLLSKDSKKDFKLK